MQSIQLHLSHNNQYRLPYLTVQDSLKLVFCGYKKLINALVRNHQVLNKTYLIFLTLSCDECKRIHARRLQHIRWFLIQFRKRESQFHYLVIWTVLYPCRLNSSNDILPEVKSSQTLRRPTERLKAAIFSSFVSYTLIISTWISRCKCTNFLRNFQINLPKLYQRAPFVINVSPPFRLRQERTELLKFE